MVVAIMKGKNKDILNLEVEALRAFFKYCSATEKIEKILQDLFPGEKDFIKGVLYQPGDGLCVIYKDMDNIPLPDFLKGKRI